MLKSIILDATHFAAEQPTGVEQYTNELLPTLSKLLLEKKVDVSWIGHLDKKPERVGIPEEVHWVHSPHQRAWSQTRLPKVLNLLQPDCYFTPSGIPPLLYKGVTAFAVHDLAVYQMPTAFSYAQRQRLTWMSKRAAIHASLLVTPSKFTASLMHRFWHSPLEKIQVIPLGFRPSKVAAVALPGVEADPLFLFVSRIEHKKNLEPVIAGFRKVAASRACQLVLAGRDGLGAKTIHKQVSQLPDGIRERVILPGYVSDGQKAWLYGRAKAAIIPSRVEGFGLPVLDAFAAGVPAICAQAGALIEVGLDAAYYAQADIATDWAIQMNKVLDNPVEVRHMVERGTNYLKGYDWNKTAKLTAEALLAL